MSLFSKRRNKNPGKKIFLKRAGGEVHLVISLQHLLLRKI